MDALGSIILEQVGLNTPPVIALAALSLLEQNNDAIILALATEHVIENKAELQRVISDSVALSEEGKLVIFGIVPTNAETGYGYIHKGYSHANIAIDVNKFVEKPDAVTAEKYSNSGEYLWNSGMLMFKASRYIEELEKY